jgi:hypothetical protein
MNLDTHTFSNPHEVATSASGANYDWSVSGREATIPDHALSLGKKAHAVVTSKPAIITSAFVIVAMLGFGSFSLISDMREKAYHAKLQRESRIVVL